MSTNCNTCESCENLSKGNLCLVYKKRIDRPKKHDECFYYEEKRSSTIRKNEKGEKFYD